MLQDTSNFLFSAMMLEIQDPNIVNEDNKAALGTVINTFPYQLLKKRCEGAGFKISPIVCVFLSLSFPRPSSLVLFCHAMYHDILKRGAFDSLYTLSDLSLLFPLGFPDAETQEKAWVLKKSVV